LTLKVPSWITAAGKENVGFPAAPSPFVTVISSAVPVSARVCTTPVVVVDCIMPVASADSGCSAVSVAFGVCVMYVAFSGALSVMLVQA
jgi:hypothetical protein